MQALFDSVERLTPSTVAVVGLAKNCGKTTALNALLAEYGRRGIEVAVTSAGRDGEPEDALTHLPKPRIGLPCGALAATAEGTLERWDAPRKVLGRLGTRGPMGEVLLVQATGAGQAEIAGPNTVAAAAAAVAELRRLGARRILIDGAFDRIAVGHPGLADAVVLAVGAVLAGSAQSVARTVGERVRLLSLPTPPESDAALLLPLGARLGDRAAAVLSPHEVRDLPRTALSDPHRVAAAAQGARWVLCGGALTDALLNALEAGGAHPTVVAADATRVFLEPGTLGRWERHGGRVCVLRRIRLAALVTNPHNPTGSDLDPAALADAVAAATPGLPVFDVVAGLARNT